ncbi:MAG: transposase [Bacteroidota bacterium]
MGLRGRLSFIEDRVYFVTTTVVDFAPVFTEDKYCDILVRNIKYYQQRYHFSILGYVIMQTHFHWVVEVEPELGYLSDVMRDIKKYSAWDLMEALEIDRRGDLLRLFQKRAVAYTDQDRKFWMKRFDDEVIRNVGMLRTKLEYIHFNPVKAGLVENPEHYKYSSARNYVLNEHSVLPVNTDWSM